MKAQQIILFPLTFFYALGLMSHRALYRIGILKTKPFNVPIINVGNLSMGGTGKSPHTEMLHRLLKNERKLALVSRGYGRKTTGFRYVELSSKAAEVGDEPKLLKNKLPNSLVAVCEKRAIAVEQILKDFPKVNTFILDDAFQHWAIQASTSILLTTFDAPFFEDHLFPAGRLREFRSGYQRADIIIVSKCPPNISPEQKQSFLDKMQALPHQNVFFTYYHYQRPYFLLNHSQSMQKLQQEAILVVTAIADTLYLEDYIAKNSLSYDFLRFPDHHFYSPKDLDLIQEKAKGKTIVVTEKDAEKLIEHRALIKKKGLRIFVLAIEVRFAFDEEDLFKKTVLAHIYTSRKNSC